MTWLNSRICILTESPDVFQDIDDIKTTNSLQCQTASFLPFSFKLLVEMTP